MLRHHFALAPRARLEETPAGRFLVCTHPLQAYRLNDSAWALLNALRPGVALEDTLREVTPATLRFLQDKAARGALRAGYALLPAGRLPPVEVVIPVLDDPARLLRCLHALAAQDYPPDAVAVTVVDDASAVPQEHALPEPPPAALRLRWLRLAANLGPASARNEALRTPWAWHADGPAPLLAFVDSDGVPGPDWLRTLAAVLETPGVVAAGTGVTPLHTRTWLARYEGACSSLHLGAHTTPVAQGDTGPAYLPSCNLAVRREALQAVDGFQDGLRLAEDVDLSWRLADAGGALYYVPQGAVAHDYRDRWGSFLRRKAAYAASEALLARTHPGRMRGHRPRGAHAAVGLTAAALAGAGTLPGATPAALLAIAAVVALGVEGAVAVRGGLRGAGWPGPLPTGLLLAAAGRRALAALLQACRWQTRHLAAPGLLAGLLWWPLLPLVAGVAALGTLAEGLARRPGLEPATFAAGHLAECLAYSAGWLRGVATGGAAALVAARQYGRG